MLPISRILFAASLFVSAGVISAQEATPASAQSVVPGQLNPAQTNAPVTAAQPANEPSWMPKADPTQGLVIIFRERHLAGGGTKWTIYYDESEFPPVKNGKFTYAYLPPGDHTLYAIKKNRKDARLLSIEPGDVYFFSATLGGGLFGAGVDLLETDPAIAKQKISALLKR